MDDEPSSVPSILAISSSMLNSTPELHLGSLGDGFSSWPSPPVAVWFLGVCWVGGKGGALGCIYVLLSFCSGGGGRSGRAGPSVVFDPGTGRGLPSATCNTSVNTVGIITRDYDGDLQFLDTGGGTSFRGMARPAFGTSERVVIDSLDGRISSPIASLGRES